MGFLLPIYGRRLHDNIIYRQDTSDVLEGQYQRQIYQQQMKVHSADEELKGCKKEVDQPCNTKAVQFDHTALRALKSSALLCGITEEADSRFDDWFSKITLVQMIADSAVAEKSVPAPRSLLSAMNGWLIPKLCTVSAAWKSNRIVQLLHGGNRRWQ